MTNHVTALAPCPVSSEQVSALILAGGQSRRMQGENKAFVEFNGKPMIEYIIEQISPCISGIMLSANRDLEQFSQYGFPVLTDSLQDFGPLAGILAGFQATSSRYLLISPCDTPLVQTESTRRLLQACIEQESPLFVAHDGEQRQYLHAVIRTDLQSSLKNFLESGQRKVRDWYQQHPCVEIDCSDLKKSFFNINTKIELINISDE